MIQVHLEFGDQRILDCAGYPRSYGRPYPTGTVIHESLEGFKIEFPQDSKDSEVHGVAFVYRSSGTKVDVIGKIALESGLDD